MRCFNCSADMLAGHVEHVVTISGVKVRGSLPANVCPKCGEDTVEADALSAFELSASHVLGQYPVRTAEVLRFMRKALGLRAADLAELLGVNLATISRWENEHGDLPALAFNALADMVADRMENRTTTIDRLRGLARPPSHLPAVLDIQKPPIASA